MPSHFSRFSSPSGNPVSYMTWLRPDCWARENPWTKGKIFVDNMKIQFVHTSIQKMYFLDHESTDSPECMLGFTLVSQNWYMDFLQQILNLPLSFVLSSKDIEPAPKVSHKYPKTGSFLKRYWTYLWFHTHVSVLKLAHVLLYFIVVYLGSFYKHSASNPFIDKKC